MHWLGITESNFDSLWFLVLITNLSTLLPLPFLNWLPADDSQAEIELIPNLMSEIMLREPESETVE
jgi:BT1 family.